MIFMSNQLHITIIVPKAPGFIKSHGHKYASQTWPWLALSLPLFYMTIYTPIYYKLSVNACFMYIYIYM